MSTWSWKAARYRALALNLCWILVSISIAADAADLRSSTAYVITLQSLMTEPVTDDIGLPTGFHRESLVISPFEKEGRIWYRIQVGKFDSEARARDALLRVRQTYPGAWLTTLDQKSMTPEKPDYETSDGEAKRILHTISVSSTKTKPSRNILIQSLPPGLERRVSRISLDGVMWYRLQVGRFPNETEARTVLAAIRVEHPGAWLDTISSQIHAQTEATSLSAGDEVRYQAQAFALEEDVVPAPTIDATPQVGDRALPEPDAALGLDTTAKPDPTQDIDASTESDAVPEADASTEPEAVPEPGAPPDVAFYAIIVNRQDFGVTTVLLTESGDILVRGADLELWNLYLPEQPVATVFGNDYYDPAELPGYEVTIDEPTLTAQLTFAADAFQPTILGASAPLPEAVVPGVGGFANYDFFATHTNVPGDNPTQLEGIFELGMFSPWGVATSEFAGLNLVSINQGSRSADRELIRLESTWRRDWPNAALTLELGDSFGRSGIWGRPVRFGGVQWGRNFSTQPNFVTFPLPDVSGEAVLPSNADLFIDETLRQTQDISPGAFDLVDLPVVTGGGEAQLVVRDILGREQVISVPFYASNQLLAEGLTDFGLEVGFVREDLGIESNNYGRFLAVATARRGLSQDLTVEGRAELLEDQQTFGFGGSYVLPFLMLATAANAVSFRDGKVGNLLVLGLENRRTFGPTFSIQTQWSTPDFTQVGLAPDRPAPRFRINAALGIPRVGPGSPNITYSLLDERDGFRRELLSASYTAPVSRHGALIAFATKSLVDEGELSVGITYIQTLSNRDTVSARYDNDDGEVSGSLTAQRSLPVGEGFGYRARVEAFGEVARQEAEGFVRTSIGTYGLGASHATGIVSYRAEADGGIAYHGGKTKLMRPVDRSFATVKVGSYPDVDVYLNNQPVAKTDDEGVAWIPDLLAYQTNKVSIDVLDLPLDAEIGLEDLELVPYYRSGIVGEFLVKPSRGALLVIILDDGMPLPAGATVSIVDSEDRFPVAREGEAYVTGMEKTTRLEAIWRDQRCTFEVEIPAGAGPIPRIGPLLCSGVTR